MTAPVVDGDLCVLCGQAAGETSPLDRSADSGPMLLAVHSDGTVCGYVAHDLCVRYVRAHGPLSDVDCLCGRGPVVEGIPRTGWSLEAPTRRERGDADHASGYEPPTLRGPDEQDSDADSGDDPQEQS